MVKIRPLSKTPQEWAIAIGIAILAGVLLAFLGPFGSYLNDGLPMRILYWTSSTLAGLVFYGGTFSLALRAAPPGSRAAWLMLASAALLASVLQMLFTRMMAVRMWPHLADRFPGWPGWYLQVLVIGVVIALAYAYAHRVRRVRDGRETFQSAAEFSGAEEAPAKATAILRGGEVIALEMEDHYVRVHRASGSELILMPLVKAIDLVSAVEEGLRTHRSWWVARSAVDGVEGTARSMNLRLSNGVNAPVSRRAVARLREAGWI